MFLLNFWLFLTYQTINFIYVKYIDRKNSSFEKIVFKETFLWFLLLCCIILIDVFKIYAQREVELSQKKIHLYDRDLISNSTRMHHTATNIELLKLGNMQMIKKGL